MSEKPGKRLVTWKQYVQTLCKKVALNTSAVVSGCLGIYFLIGAAFSILLAVVRPLMMEGGYWLTLITAGLGIVATWFTTILIRKSKKIEPVTPITRHNTGQLPEIETLVRASDLPLSHQQAELLRAAQHGSETPPEELLRATANSQGD